MDGMILFSHNHKDLSAKIWEEPPLLLLLSCSYTIYQCDTIIQPKDLKL
jgi:hypothetical protein